MKRITFIIYLLFTLNTYAIEVFCKFEEVYVDGTTQQGFFLIKDELLRYQYNNKALYTIFKNEDGFYLVENQDKSKFRRVNNNTEILQELIQLGKIYPNIQENYYLQDKEIILFKSKQINFLKRLVIKSDNLNLSVYFKDCKLQTIHKSYFRHRPVIEYHQ